MVANLAGRRLPHIDIGELGAMRGGDAVIRRQHRGQHDDPPPTGWIVAADVARAVRRAVRAGVLSRAEAAAIAAEVAWRLRPVAQLPDRGLVRGGLRDPHSSRPAQHRCDSPTAEAYAPKCARAGSHLRPDSPLPPESPWPNGVSHARARPGGRQRSMPDPGQSVDRLPDSSCHTTDDAGQRP